MKLSNEIGKRYGRLTIIQEVTREEGDYIRKVIAVCDCGRVKQYKLSHLSAGSTVSCKCYQQERVKEVCGKHLLTRHPLFKIRRYMIVRCYNPKSLSYKNYGGRGIEVCKQWRDDFKSFYDWAILNGWRKELQIDRINNNGNYEPVNCRFVTPSENCRNRRSTVIVEYRNEKKPLCEWSSILGIKITTLWSRIFMYEWSVERAFNEPIGNYFNR